jgi:hypothetical protein
MEYELTPEAIELGLGVALPAVLDLGQKREFGRGERSGAHTFQLIVWIVGGTPGTIRLVRSA